MCASRCDRGRRASRASLLAAVVAASTLVAAPAAAGEGAAPFDAASYEAFLDQVSARRTELGARFAAARGQRARAAVRNEARQFIVETLVSRIFPAWMGMPSGGGVQATASRPHEP